MAATDQFYRSQRTLDVVFGASCVLMLVSLVVMFYQDQKKEWKDEQRLANDVEEAMAQRDLVKALPSAEKIQQAEGDVKAAQDALAGRKAEVHTLLAEASDNFKAYGVSGHRHAPEIRQGLEAIAGKPVSLQFTPHLVPMIRGIHSTLYARLTDAGRKVDFQKLYLRAGIAQPA